MKTPKAISAQLQARKMAVTSGPPMIFRYHGIIPWSSSSDSCWNEGSSDGDHGRLRCPSHQSDRLMDRLMFDYVLPPCSPTGPLLLAAPSGLLLLLRGVPGGAVLLSVTLSMHTERLIIHTIIIFVL